MMELITRTKLMIQLLVLFVISERGSNLMVGTDAGEIRRAYISPYDTINKVSLTQKGYIQVSPKVFHHNLSSFIFYLQLHFTLTHSSILRLDYKLFCVLLPVQVPQVSRGRAAADRIHVLPVDAQRQPQLFASVVFILK